MTREEEIIRAAKADAKANRLAYPEVAIEHGFVHGAEWAFDFMEHNRLTACDNQTEEEAEREQRFVINFIAENDRTPTFSDCIEITRKQIIDKACDYIRKDWWNMLVYDVNNFGGSQFNLDKTIDRFRKAMEE